MADAYDVAVIGAGPGGYVAAIAAAQAGLEVACIDGRGALGGTCLNVGCIPSKMLLHWTARYHEAATRFAAHGLIVTGLEVDLAQLMAAKDKVVEGLTSGIAFLFKKNKVESIHGTARLAGARAVSVALADGGTREIEARNVVIATGSAPAELPLAPFDEKRIVSSTGALSLAKIPKRLAVIGADYIGLELASIWRRLGSEVTVVEARDRILASADAGIARLLQRELAKQGIAFRLSAKVTAAKARARGVTLTLESAKGTETLAAEVALVSVGRRPYTDGLGLDQAGIARDERGFVVVDDRFRTNLAGTYAIGDVIAGPMLAHRAMVEGIAVAEIIAGGHPVTPAVIPTVVYTEPEVAWVGKTEEELKQSGIDYRSGSFPFTANSRARTLARTAGVTKVLTDATTDRVLGVHLIGPEAGTIIAEAALAMEFAASAEDIARTSHPHPTLTEALMEASSLAALGRTIHI